MNLKDATCDIKCIMYIQYILLRYYKVAKIATKMQSSLGEFMVN